MVPEKKQTVRSALMIVLLSLSLRSPMSTVGPLTGQFQGDLGLSAFAAGFVTTIPVIAFCLMSPVAGKIAVAMDCKKLVSICFGAIAAGVALRSYGGAAGLYLGTAVMGLAIGTMNVLMPALIRRQFPEKIGLIMGCYLTAQTAASAFFSGYCQDIARALGDWRMGMASPVVLCLISVGAALLSGGMLQVRLEAPVSQGGGIRLRHGALALYNGIQSFIYFSMVAWLPSIAESLGAVAPGAGSGRLLMAMLLMGLVPCLLMPMVTQRVKRRGLLAFFTAAVFVMGFACMLLGGGSYTSILLGAVCCGFASTGTLSLSLTVIAEQGANAGETAKISAFCQCIGYAFAAFGPTGLGLMYDFLGRWQVVLQCLLVLSAVMTVLGLYAGKREKTETAAGRG